MNKSTEIGLQDLLFNGAIACLLLFIIFAIKANGFAVISALSGNNNLGEFQSNSSLPIKSEAIDGEMISYRKVLIEGVDASLHNTFLNGQFWQWNVSNGKIEESIQLIDNNVVLIASFTNHPEKLSLQLNANFSQQCKVKVFFIEGANQLEGRMNANKGTCSINKGKYSLRDLKINFSLDDDFQTQGVCSSNIVKIN